MDAPAARPREHKPGAPFRTGASPVRTSVHSRLPVRVHSRRTRHDCEEVRRNAARKPKDDLHLLPDKTLELRFGLTGPGSSRREKQQRPELRSGRRAEYFERAGARNLCVPWRCWRTVNCAERPKSEWGHCSHTEQTSPPDEPSSIAASSWLVNVCWHSRHAEPETRTAPLARHYAADSDLTAGIYVACTQIEAQRQTWCRAGDTDSKAIAGRHGAAINEHERLRAITGRVRSKNDH